MRLIVGLGNPIQEHAKNRHNTGFIVLDKIVSSLGLEFSERLKFKCLMSENSSTGDIYIKPTTFMNNSGEAVSAVANFYKIEPENIIVIHDDVDLEFGKIKKQKSASSAGHHGVENIIEKLGTKDFWRVRVGVGKPENKNIAVEDWVLMDFSDDELEVVEHIDTGFLG